MQSPRFRTFELPFPVLGAQLSDCFLAGFGNGTGMKVALVICAIGIVSFSASAQYKAPSQYFRKDFPAPKPGAQPQPNAPQQHHVAGSPQAPQTPAAPKFKDVGTNSQFYFMTDTNHMYPWTKISASVATNSKNGARQTFSPEMPVQH